MRLCFDISEDLSVRLKQYLLDRYRTTHKVQQDVLRDALREYLSNRAQKSMALPKREKESEKEIATHNERTKPAVPAETKKQKGREWHGGKAPYESQYPEIAARVIGLWAGGKMAGGLSRDAVAKALREEGIPISAAIVDKITTRARKRV